MTDEKKPAPTKALAVQDKVTDLVEAILEGLSDKELAAYARDSWGGSAKDISALIDRAHGELEDIGRQNREIAFGIAIARYNKLFAASVGIQDYKTALQVQRQIDRLHGL